MHRYLISRFLYVIPTLLGAAALVFALMRLIPGDICVVRLASGGGSFNAHAVATCHAELGLDRSVAVQFLDFIVGIFQFDFGPSICAGNPVSHETLPRPPISL